MDNELQQSIAAAKAGDPSRAFELLTRASQNPACAEQAWLWLSGVVADDSESLFCLDNVLKVNPGNQAALRGATLLRQKGVFPAIPAYSESNGKAPAQEPPAFPSRRYLRLRRIFQAGHRVLRKLSPACNSERKPALPSKWIGTSRTYPGFSNMPPWNWQTRSLPSKSQKSW